MNEEQKNSTPAIEPEKKAKAEPNGSTKPKRAATKKKGSKDDMPAVDGWEVSRVLKVARPIMKGADVKALQVALIANNYHCGKDSVKGVFGKSTAYAVRCFQSHKGLIVSGKADQYTITALGGTWKDETAKIK